MPAPRAKQEQRRFASGVRSLGLYRLILLVLILVYIWIFAGLSFQQRAGMRTHKADLGQIDQAVWNSSRGRFVEMTDNGYLSTRLIDHVEPILALISPVFWVWDDVRAILLLQAVFVAAGAWLLYELARNQLESLLSPQERAKVWLAEPVRGLAGLVALALAVAYLLTPQLQSAALTEFHAIPLATPLILWALWAVATWRWRQFAIATVLVALVKEEAALLAAALGLWAMWRIAWEYWSARHASQAIEGETGAASSHKLETGPLALAAGIMVASLAWFYVATFVIVPAHAAEVYGVAESGYFQRYGALGDSPADIIKSLFTQPMAVWQIATEPARIEYLRRLAMPFGFAMLLAPEVVLLSLPVLLANLLSAYPAQVYGEFHYSAPVAVFFAAGAAYGTARLWRWASRRASRMSGDFQYMPAAGVTTMNAVAALRNSRAALHPTITLAIVLWIVAWAAAAYVGFGRGPGAARYDVTPVTAHHRTLDRFVEQLPADAAVTATAAVHPHVSHRRYVYQFPTGLEEPGRADWALLDVTTTTDMAPGDLRATVEAMLAGEWGVVDAADGFMLLRKGASQKTLPDAFYDFAHTPSASGVDALHDAPFRFAGASVEDWPRWRQSTVTTRWQVGDGFDASTMEPQIELRSPTGETLYRYADAMPPALVWYPPEHWQPGDEITVTTLPLHLPRDWGVAVEHVPGLTVPDDLAVAAEDEYTLVAAYRRGGGDELHLLPAGLYGAPDWATWFAREMGERSSVAEAVLRMDSGETVTVQARLPERASWPGDMIDLWATWSAEDGWPEGASVFVHLRVDDENVDQNDGLPRYFVKYDVQAALHQQGYATDWRQLAVPVVAETAAEWTVTLGLYNPATGERAAVFGPDGEPLGDELLVGRVAVGPPPAPDQTCALIPETCASQRMR